MLLHVVHVTRYRYSPWVDNAHHAVHLKPASTARQTLLRHSLQISPTPAQQREIMDVYGNSRSFFSLQTSHGVLRVVASSVVSTSCAGQGCSNAEKSAVTAPPAMPWERVREQFRYRAGAAYNAAWEFVFASPYVPRDDAFTQFAQPSFAPGRPLSEAAHDLMERIYSTMVYESDSTEVNTPALAALQQGKGVCQDFAHIMVACCRAMGLPARYVSGYMLTQPPPGQPRLIGCDASHAWASVYCPAGNDNGNSNGNNSDGAGQWLDFDPTNNRAPGEDYVTLATGRDFLDVSPLRGVIRGGSRHILQVAVTVAPIESLESLDGFESPGGHDAPTAAESLA